VCVVCGRHVIDRLRVVRVYVGDCDRTVREEQRFAREFVLHRVVERYKHVNAA
jgi:hypothetical protein